MSLQDFVVSWLERATPLTPIPSSERQTIREPAPGPRPAQGANSPVGSPGAVQAPKEPAPCQRPARSPLDVPGEAVGPGAVPLPEA
jgi:hypothetical protein